MKTPLKHGPIREKGPYQQSAIQTLPALYMQHPKINAAAP